MSRWRRGRPEDPEASGDRASPPPPPPAEAAPPAEPSAPPPPQLPPLELPWPPLIHGEAGFMLRPWGSGSADAAVLSAAWQDAEIARWTKVPANPDEAAAARWISGEQRRRERGRAIDLVISGAGQVDDIYGEVGLVVVEPERRWAEIGFWLGAGARGAGLASAAVTVFSTWALRDLPVHRIFGRTDPANPASGRVLAKAGYRSMGETEQGQQVWALDRS